MTKIHQNNSKSSNCKKHQSENSKWNFTKIAFSTRRSNNEKNSNEIEISTFTFNWTRLDPVRAFYLLPLYNIKKLRRESFAPEKRLAEVVTGWILRHTVCNGMERAKEISITIVSNACWCHCCLINLNSSIAGIIIISS